MYEKDMARSGRHLFRWRKLGLYSVIAFGAVIAFFNDGRVFETEPLNVAYSIFWLLVAALGSMIRIVTSGYAAPGTSGTAKKQAEAAVLNTSGPYSVVRNPLYVGRILIFTAIAFLSGCWVYGAIVMLLSILHYERVIAFEESFLSQKFGPAYAAWGERVPGLWPNLAGYKRSDRPFWIKRAVWREINKVFFLSLALALYAVLHGHAATGYWSFDNMWVAACVILGAARLFVGFLKSFTSFYADMA